MSDQSTSQASDRPTYEAIIVDDPAPLVRRITLNRPEKRNALSNALRSELYAALDAADADDAIRLMIIRGAGSSFSSGYDLGSNTAEGQPWHTAGGDGNWPRHVVEGHFRVWDLRKPVIAQVHGYCLAGGSELATGCDVVYMAEDAKMGYPAVRFGVPDMQFHAWLVGMRRGMEMMLTGDPIDGIEAAQRGWATRAYPADQLEAKTLEMAQRIAQVPPELAQMNKRLVHRQMDAMGMRAGLRAGTELCALGTHTQAMADFLKARVDKGGLTGALQARDAKFGDYRTSHEGAEESASKGKGDESFEGSYGSSS